MASAARRSMIVLGFLFVLLLAWQHWYLDEVVRREEQLQSRRHQRLTQHLPGGGVPTTFPLPPSTPSPPPVSSLQPLHSAASFVPGLRTLRRTKELELLDGAAIGPPSRSSLCVVMPVRSNSLPRAVRNVRSWSTSRGSPCNSDAPVADLCIIHSQSFVSEHDVEQASDLLNALALPLIVAEGDLGMRGPVDEATDSRPHERTVASCFGAVRFLAARIPIERDIYTIYPTHNFSGPNEHFMTM